MIKIIKNNILLIGIILLLNSCNGKDTQKMTLFSDSVAVSSYDDGSKTSEDGLAKIFTESPFKWEGTTDNGYADGNGTIYWTNSNEKYIGNVSDGHITGYGSKYDGNELVYEGNWVDGKYSGEGTSYENEIKYVGGFLNGEKNGDGAIYSSDGTKMYEGEFSDDLPNGYGELYDVNGECIRKGYFDNSTFREEDSAQSLASKLGREVVRQEFDGGTNINPILYAARYNKDKSEIEIIIDLTFDGNFDNTNHYNCRVACRNYYPEIEFLYKNSTAENYLGAKTAIMGALVGIDIYNDLFNN